MLAAALEAVDVLVNSASYRLNLEAMQACLAAGCHYLDLGGLYWMTLRQLELAEQFADKALLAVLGIGSSPGKTNVMALAGVRELGAEPVASIEVLRKRRCPPGVVKTSIFPLSAQRRSVSGSTPRMRLASPSVSQSSRFVGDAVVVVMP